MNWIRMATGMKSDPRIHLLADACCKGDAAKAVGHLQFLFSEMPEHARDGNLHDVPPSVVEVWALWNGKRGAFDTAFRSAMCTEDGIVRSWAKHNGDAMDKAERERARVQEWRKSKQKNDEQLPNDTPDKTRTRTRNTTRTEQGTQRVNGTERNGTKEEEERAEPPAPSSSAMRQQDLAELERVLAMLPEPKHRDAIRGYALRQPASKLLALSATIEGLGPHGIHAAASTWYQLGRGVMDAILANDGPSVGNNMFRGCIRKAPTEPPKLTLVPKDEPGTVRDTLGKIVWSPGDPPMYQPTLEQIAQNGWSVAA